MLTLLISVATLVALAGSAAFFPGLGDNTPVASQGAVVPPPSGPRLIAQELRGGVTLVWEIPAVAPERRKLLARIEHRDGYGPRLALSPDGESLAGAGQ
ncbi:MAG: hypothetical protein NTZ05_02750, partial [Chloroflexi bacterium]|nr:hypothetical protein [Chloroflexota bacterium]